MKTSRKLPRVSRDEEDRISNLPDPIIWHILSFLPTKSAAATSVLSKTWEFQWTKTTTVDFSLDSGKNGEEEEETVRKFSLLVNSVLFNFKIQRPEKFQLWWSLRLRDPIYVSLWISHAICLRVRVIVIEFVRTRFHGFDFDLPGILFTSDSLEHLKLKGCFVLKVPKAVCLPRLDTLDLCGFYCKSSKSLPRLISGCPVLSFLRIDWSCESRIELPSLRVSSASLTRFVVRVFENKVEIDAPNLEHLTVLAAKECSVIRPYSVNHVVLDTDMCHRSYHTMKWVDGCNRTVKLVESVNRAKVLTLKLSILKSLSYASTPLSVSFLGLLVLDVSVECCNWSYLGDFLGRSTKLQVLKISKTRCSKKTGHKLCWNDPTKVPECFSSSLQNVSFVDFSGLKDEILMIKYVLQHGKVLKSLTLKCAGLKIKSQLLQYIASFPKLSRACQLQIN